MSSQEQKPQEVEKPKFTGKNAYAANNSKTFIAWHVQNRRKRRKSRAEE